MTPVIPLTSKQKMIYSLGIHVIKLLKKNKKGWFLQGYGDIGVGDEIGRDMGVVQTIILIIF